MAEHDRWQRPGVVRAVGRDDGGLAPMVMAVSHNRD
jgi:hypothetical protein